MADKVIYWSKTGLTGGAATDLDSIDGAALQDGEIAHVWISNVLYIYLLDVDSGAAESSPAIIAPDTNAGDKRWILQSYYSGSGTLYTDHIAESTAAHGVEIDGLTIKDSGFAIGSDADGDMYYRASSALARLAKGTYGTILCMNSAATAPEWGGVYGYGVVTKDISTISGAVDQAVTISPAFKPSRGIIFTFIQDNTCFSVGAVQGTGTNYGYNRGYNGLGTYAAVPCYLEISAGNVVKFGVKSMDTSGLTITWEKDAGTLAGTAYVMCFMFRG
jgi:hypothetical protein